MIYHAILIEDLMKSIYLNLRENSAQQWPEQIRVLLATIPKHLKGDSK
jgi:hypothetical protein